MLWKIHRAQSQSTIIEQKQSNELHSYIHQCFEVQKFSDIQPISNNTLQKVSTKSPSKEGATYLHAHILIYIVPLNLVFWYTCIKRKWEKGRKK